MALAVLTVSALGTGCASYTEETREIRSLYRSEAYKEALAKLERTIATTTTPRTVTTVRTVEGKVWQVSAPNSVILTLADGTNKQYKIPKGQKFMIEGQEKTAFELRKGMNVSVTAMTTGAVWSKPDRN